MKFISSEMLWKYLIPGVAVFALANSPLANAESFVDLSAGKTKAKVVHVKKEATKKSAKKALEQTDAQATPTTNKFLPDSQLPELSSEAYVDHDWMVSFYPLAGWELKKTPGTALTMIEPVGLTTGTLVKKGYDKSSDSDFVETSQTTFKRAVTVASIEGGVPFDQNRIASFEQSLLDTFGKKMRLRNFTLVNKPEFFDHRGEKDAIVAYTEFSTAKHDLKQMHILVGGATNQVHLVYTDLAEHFETRSDYINKVWSSMTSVNVEGVSPKPFLAKIEKYIPFIAAAFLLVMLLIIIQKMQLRNNMRRAIAEIDLQDGEYREYKSETVWNIGLSAPHSNWMDTQTNRVKQSASTANPHSGYTSEMAPISHIFGTNF